MYIRAVTDGYSEYIWGTKCFGMYFFRVPKSPKLSIFLGLAGLSSTLGNSRHLLIGVPPGAGDKKFLLLFESKMKRRKLLLCVR